MNIGLLFEELHGYLKKDTLVPLEQVTEELRWVYKDRVHFPSQKKIKKMANALAVPSETLFFNPNFVICPFVYYSDVLLVDIHQFTQEFIAMTQLQKLIEQQEKRLKTEREKGDFKNLFHYLDKRVLFDVYRNLYHELPASEKYPIFRDLHMRSEYGFTSLDPAFIRSIFSYQTDGSFKEELKKRADKEGYIRVYRGQTEKSSPLEEAYCWTTSMKVAQFFATRFDSDGEIMEKKVHIDHVVDFLMSRNEYEVLILPEYIEDI